MKTVDKEKLWEEYQKNKTPQLREQIILEYAPLVKLVAGRLSMYLGYNVEYEDLVSYGIFGLIDAIDKFDMGKEVKFESTQVDESAQHFYRKLGYKDCGGMVIDLSGYEQPMELFLIKGI